MAMAPVGTGFRLSTGAATCGFVQAEGSPEGGCLAAREPVTTTFCSSSFDAAAAAAPAGGAAGGATAAERSRATSARPSASRSICASGRSVAACNSRSGPPMRGPAPASSWPSSESA